MTVFIRITSVIVAISAIVFGFLYRPDAVQKERSDYVWLLCMLVVGICLTIFFWQGNPRPKDSASDQQKLVHNSQRIIGLITVGFFLLGIQLLRYQVVIPATGEYDKAFYTPKGEYVQNPRLIGQQLSTQRGRIFDTYGNVAVGTEVNNDGLVKRTYANPFIAPLAGYYSPLQFGNSGLEKSFDDYLNGGGTGSNAFITWQRELLHLPVKGNDLYLTIEPNLQRLAVQQMGNLPGSIVLMDAETGAILAMVGKPDFNPADLVFDPTQEQRQWNQQLLDIQKRWEALNKQSGQPLLPKATQGLYVPGSAFKTFTLATILDVGKSTPDAIWEDRGTFTVDGFTIRGDNRPDRNKTTWTTTECYIFSLNICFAQMGLTVGAPDFIKYGERFGIGKTIPFDLPVEPSRLFNTPNFLNSRPALATSGFGQGELQMTPLELVLMTAAIGRGDGIMPKPFLVKEIRTQDRQLLKETKPENWLAAIQSATATNVRNIMIESAKRGYVGQNGGGLTDTGAVVGGKTGTAEAGNGLFNANYIAWASKGGRTFAIAVVVEKQPNGEGLALALPRANAVLRAVLAQVR
jgi:peptidoglycan glycosyltransferase